MEIDVEALRSYLLDLCGTAMACGIGPAALMLSDVEQADAYALLRIAEDLGVDVRRFCL